MECSVFPGVARVAHGDRVCSLCVLSLPLPGDTSLKFLIGDRLNLYEDAIAVELLLRHCWLSILPNKLCMCTNHSHPRLLCAVGLPV